MHEALRLGWYGSRLLKFFALLIKEGDATNIAEIWSGMPEVRFTVALILESCLPQIPKLNAR